MQVNKFKKIVIKLGSSTVVDNKGKFKSAWVQSLIKDIKSLKKNTEVIVVSSGAIALGQNFLKIKKKKIKIEMSQAIAAVGQIHLSEEFRKNFNKQKLKTAQILVSLDDTEQRRRALNIRRTFENLFKIKAVPIVNENDTTATSEIKYGDNDRLAARVAQIVNADALILLSNVNGLYDNKKKLIKSVDTISDEILNLANKDISNYGSGGMITKIEAAKICMNAGCLMYIANGNIKYPITNMKKNKVYTCFKPKISTLDARKKWIVSSLISSGKIQVDKGAEKALKNGKSLLAIGIIKIDGSFSKGDNILILNENNDELARGLSSFSSKELIKIIGKRSKEIEKILGYPSKSEVVHIDDMVKI
tara:strand:+ start:65 stop:1150 length:1086 start_codon:yes stop_codon:yes gene_type:complete